MLIDLFPNWLKCIYHLNKPYELFLNFETTGKNKILPVNFSVIFIFNNQQHKY